MCDALGRQVAGRNYPPTNKNTLTRALTEEWDKLPQQLLDNVVQNFTKVLIKFSKFARHSSKAHFSVCGGSTEKVRELKFGSLRHFTNAQLGLSQRSKVNDPFEC
ncbi:hypothetical protein TNCV_4107371 [Trichonephila clavipes]|nr:hypothetical protein TNCV_4107371 [Trichonephila clavipes]